jgi:hypothetical protein
LLRHLQLPELTRLFTTDGDDAGEATYAMNINGGQELRVLDGVPIEEEEEDLPFVGLLRVEPV